jgi:hypothetical protein
MVNLTCANPKCGREFSRPAKQKRRRNWATYCCRLCFISHARKPEDRFWKFVFKTDSCWLWTGGTLGGYGRFTYYERGEDGIAVGRRHEPAHAFAYRTMKGPIAGLHVLHKCDTPLCVNPDHLFLGTPLDNMHDRNATCRHAHGERHGKARLTWEKVRQIRERRSKGETQVALAISFGVSRRNIRAIVNDEIWVEH